MKHYIIITLMCCNLAQAGTLNTDAPIYHKDPVFASAQHHLLSIKETLGAFLDFSQQKYNSQQTWPTEGSLDSNLFNELPMTLQNFADGSVLITLHNTSVVTLPKILQNTKILFTPQVSNGKAFTWICSTNIDLTSAVRDGYKPTPTNTISRFVGTLGGMYLNCLVDNTFP